MGVLMLLAPSKTMDFASPLPYQVTPETPLFIEEATRIATKLGSYTQHRMSKLMNISRPIAISVVNMYDNWNSEAAGRPALWTYKGDVYKGMKAYKLDAKSAEWAQNHLLILSGLYGLIRPYDGIQAYRLEMKSQLKIGRSNTLNEFWGDKLSQYVSSRGSNWICNLSSNEYAKPALRHLTKDVLVITPVFFDSKSSGVVGTVPIYSKMMRGVVCRWIIDNQVDSPAQLEQFTGHGYAYDAARSKLNFPAFSRKVMKPLVFSD
jgi:cytoplasmic iron level regulating protein YaaA (DUF328/UPF0246 family)